MTSNNPLNFFMPFVTKVGRPPSGNLLDFSQPRYDRYSARTISQCKSVRGVIEGRQHHERQVPRKPLPSGKTSFTSSTLTLSMKYTIAIFFATMSLKWDVLCPETKRSSPGRTSGSSVRRFGVQRQWESYPYSAKDTVEVLVPRRTELWPAQRMSRIYKRWSTK